MPQIVPHLQLAVWFLRFNNLLNLLLLILLRVSQGNAFFLKEFVEHDFMSSPKKAPQFKSKP
jgi:hypothetical protein